MSVSALLTKYRAAGNLGNLARDFFATNYNVGPGFIINYFYSGSNPAAIILDASIKNNTAVTQTVYLDGVPVTVTAGSTISISNTPFIEFRANANIDIMAAGIFLRTLEALASGYNS